MVVCRSGVICSVLGCICCDSMLGLCGLVVGSGLNMLCVIMNVSMLVRKRIVIS